MPCIPCFSSFSPVSINAHLNDLVFDDTIPKKSLEMFVIFLHLFFVVAVQDAGEVIFSLVLSREIVVAPFKRCC